MTADSWADETALVNVIREVVNMPSKSKPQARLMAAAAHTPSGFGGVPQKVGKEFNRADTGTKRLSNAMKKKHK